MYVADSFGGIAVFRKFIIVFLNFGAVDGGYVLLADNRNDMAIEHRDISVDGFFEDIAGVKPVFVLPFPVSFVYRHSFISKK